MRNGVLRIAAVLVAALLAWSPAARAQSQEIGPNVHQITGNNIAYGTTSAEFLALPATARGAALGGTFAALANDLGSLFYNPAGLALMGRPGVMANSMNYLASTTYASGGIAFPFAGGAKAIGLSVTTFGFGDQPVYTIDDPQGLSGEKYSVRETAIAGTYAQQFSDRFSAGITMKMVQDQLGSVSGQAFAIDFGTNFHSVLAGRSIRAAFVITNLGTSLKHSGDPLTILYTRPAPAGQQNVAQEPARGELQTKSWSLPVMFRVALAYDAFATSMSRLTVLGEFNQPNNNQPGFSFGSEYNLNLGQSGFAVVGRLGLTYAADASLSAPSSTSADYAGFDSGLTEKQYRFSAGGGLKYAKGNFGIGFDYAYKNYGLLGGVNMLGVSLNW